MTLRDIERVLYFEAYVVTDPGMTPLKKCSIMSEDDYRRQARGIRRRVSRPAWAPKASRTCCRASTSKAAIEKLRAN